MIRLRSRVNNQSSHLHAKHKRKAEVFQYSTPHHAFENLSAGDDDFGSLRADRFQIERVFRAGFLPIVCLMPLSVQFKFQIFPQGICQVEN